MRQPRFIVPLLAAALASGCAGWHPQERGNDDNQCAYAGSTGAGSTEGQRAAFGGRPRGLGCDADYSAATIAYEQTYGITQDQVGHELRAFEEVFRDSRTEGVRSPG